MSTRQRMTWQQQRQAASPPASMSWKPEHPAAYPDPKADQYENGDTSSWAEDPTKGPYKQPAAPASVSWTPDHPAAKPDAAGAAPAQKQAALVAQAEAKAAKCIRVAQAVLPKTASAADVEGKALEMMNWKEAQLDNALTRLRLAFLTASQEPTAEDLGLFVSENFPENVGNMSGAQNDPGHYDFTGHMDDDPEVAMMLAEMLDEEGAPEEKKAHDMFDAYDMDGDGFITEDEWGGHPDIFMALDDDEDGVLSNDEISMGLGSSFGRVASDTKAKAARRAQLAKKVAQLRKAKAAEEEVEEEAPEDKKAMKLASRIAHWISQGDAPEYAAMLASMELGYHTAEEVEDEDDEAEEKKAEVMLAEMLAESGKTAEEVEEDEDEDSDDSDKQASDKVAELTEALRHAEKTIAAMQKQLACAQDPMQVAGEEPDEDEKLASLFGKKAEEVEEDEDDEAAEKAAAVAKAAKQATARKAAAAKAAKQAEDDAEDDSEIEFDSAEDDEEGEDEDKNEKKASAQRPQLRKASQGVKQLGTVRVASTGGDDLSKLWASAPDVSDVFGN